MKTFMVFTEDKNREKIKEIVGVWFDGFTLLFGQGYWVGKCIPQKIYKEDSLVIVIIARAQDHEKVQMIARRIKQLNNQESVMVSSFDTEMEMI